MMQSNTLGKSDVAAAPAVSLLSPAVLFVVLVSVGCAAPSGIETDGKLRSGEAGLSPAPNSVHVRDANGTGLPIAGYDESGAPIFEEKVPEPTTIDGRDCTGATGSPLGTLLVDWFRAANDVQFVVGRSEQIPPKQLKLWAAFEDDTENLACASNRLRAHSAAGSEQVRRLRQGLAEALGLLEDRVVENSRRFREMDWSAEESQEQARSRWARVRTTYDVPITALVGAIEALQSVIVDCISTTNQSGDCASVTPSEMKDSLKEGRNLCSLSRQSEFGRRTDTRFWRASCGLFDKLEDFTKSRGAN